MVHDLQAFRIRRLSLQAGQSASSILANGISSCFTRAFMSLADILCPPLRTISAAKSLVRPAMYFLTFQI